jgi:hypothetical protein
MNGAGGVSPSRETPDLSLGSYATIAAPVDVWAWRRGEQHAVFVNCYDGDVAVGDVAGRVVIGTDRARDGETITGSLHLGGWEGLVVDLDAPALRT